MQINKEKIIKGINILILMVLCFTGGYYSAYQMAYMEATEFFIDANKKTNPLDIQLDNLFKQIQESNGSNNNTSSLFYDGGSNE